MPWIDKFWIFGLLDGPEAAKELEGHRERGTWEPPGNAWLKELNQLVDKFVRKAEFDKRRGATEGVADEKVRDDLIAESEVFEEGLQALRGAGLQPEDSLDILKHSNVCLRTAATRHALHGMMLDEVAYRVLVEYPAPPLFLLFVGDLPNFEALSWPVTLQTAHMHVVGQVPELGEYRQLVPNLSVTDWTRWLRNSVDENISQTVRKHIAPPFS